MQVVVIRHAVTEARDVFAETGQPDELRPLTDKGIKRMRRGARGLTRVLPRIDLLAASPLVRAWQTAELVAAAYGDGLHVTRMQELVPGGAFEALCARLRDVREAEVVALVGHEPDSSRAVSAWLGVSDRAVLELKKGAACLLELGRELQVGTALLRWALTPAQLRSLGEGP